MTVDHGAPEPAYQQLAAILRATIAKSEWRNGPLPSVKQLQQEHGVGRDTVLCAVGILRKEGLVFTVPRPRYLRQPRRQVAPLLVLLWGPSGDDTPCMRRNNPQVAARRAQDAERL